MNIDQSKLLFLCAVDRHKNDYCSDPQILLQLPYLEIKNIDDFCSMNGYYAIDHEQDICSDAYQKAINRSMIPDDLDNRLYRKHIIGNEEFLICLIELRLDYLSILFQRKMQIPNRSFFFKLCTIHYKLLYNEYFLSMFYTHTVSERLIYSDVNKDMTIEDIQQQIISFLAYCETNGLVPVYHNKILALDDKHSVHIPIGDTTGGQFLKTKNSRYNLNLNGSIILAERGLQNKTTLVDYIYQNNKPHVDARNFIAKSSLIITSENRLFEWKDYLVSLEARIIVIASIEDLMSISYEYLLYVDFVIITSNLIESKEYQKLVSEYKISKLSYLHAISIMREEYKKLNNVLEEISPVLSIVKWNYIIFDEIELKDQSDLYFSFICQHKIFLAEPNMDNAETGIKLLFGYPSSLQRNFLTQEKVQQCIIDHMMVITRSSINPDLLPNVAHHTINFQWTYPEQFFISYFKDTLKYNLARRLDIIPTNSFVDHVNHIFTTEEVRGIVDEHYRKKKDIIEDTLQTLKEEKDTLEAEFRERGIVCNSQQVRIQVSDGHMDRHDIMGVFEILDKYMHYTHEIMEIEDTLNNLMHQWEFVFQQVDKLDNDERCEICFESLNYKNIGFSITCGHIYCYKCLQQHRQSQSRPVKSCPGCRQNMELKNVIIYHRHPVMEHNIPNYNTKLNILKELIETTNGSYILYIPQVNESDIRVIQHELTHSGISCAIYEGNMYERLRLIKMFQAESQIRVLIISSPLDFTVHAPNIILLRSHIETNTLNTITKIPVWDLIKGSFETLQQRYQTLNIFEFNLLESEDMDTLV